MAIVTPAESSVAAVPVSVSKVPHSGDEVVLAMTISQYTPVTTASARAVAIATLTLVTPCGLKIMILPSQFHFAVILSTSQHSPRSMSTHQGRILRNDRRLIGLCWY